MNVCVVLVAAGKGKRLGGVDKAFLRIHGKEMLLYSLSVFLSISYVKEIIVVLNNGNISRAKRIIKNEKVRFAFGGDTRADSVRNGIEKATSSLVMVHDAARPFVTRELIEKLVSSIGNADAVIPVLSVKPTIKEVEEGFVKKTLDRSKLVTVQTPQLFKRSRLLDAYEKISTDGITDEATLIERIGGKVKVVKGLEENIKVTTPFDLIVLEGIIKKWNGK
jgi:2-C-methyl-D-erythritol 4-phosphate cytidylyltransferase